MAENDRRPALGRFWIGVPGRLQDGKCHDVMARVAKRWCNWQKRSNTYNSGDSLVVTHLTTNPPVSCLYMAERTGSLIFMILWSYVEERTMVGVNILDMAESNP